MNTLILNKNKDQMTAWFKRSTSPCFFSPLSASFQCQHNVKIIVFFVSLSALFLLGHDCFYTPIEQFSSPIIIPFETIRFHYVFTNSNLFGRLYSNGCLSLGSIVLSVICFVRTLNYLEFCAFIGILKLIQSLWEPLIWSIIYPVGTLHC